MRNGTAVNSARRSTADWSTWVVFLVALAVLTLVGLDYRNDPFLVCIGEMLKSFYRESRNVEVRV